MIDILRPSDNGRKFSATIKSRGVFPQLSCTEGLIVTGGRESNGQLTCNARPVDAWPVGSRAAALEAAALRWMLEGFPEPTSSSWIPQFVQRWTGRPYLALVSTLCSPSIPL